MSRCLGRDESSLETRVLCRTIFEECVFHKNGGDKLIISVLSSIKRQ